ncbi:MAG: hypothetical protein QXY52_04320 [Conexivisphaerales archaeon]
MSTDGKELGKACQQRNGQRCSVIRPMIPWINAAMGAEPVIKPNSTGKSKGSYVRSKVVRGFLNDPTAWKHRYGQRWKRCSLR